MRLPIESYEARDEATSYLADQLRAGTLCVVLGAGASAPLGLPGWEALIEACYKAQGLGSPVVRPDLAASVLAAHCKKSGSDIRDVVSASLYASGRPSPKQLTSAPRLSALGALLMGSRRGSVQTVMTFNYDSILEEYLALHGYESRVISELPRLHGAEDVTIYHPHGYLPAAAGLGSRSEDIVLTKESFNRMMGSPSNPWIALLRHIVRTKVLLMIGLSENSVVDGPLATLLQAEAPTLLWGGPAAVWPVTAALDQAHATVVRNELVAAVVLPDFDAIDEFILEICRVAATRSKLVASA